MSQDHRPARVRLTTGNMISIAAIVVAPLVAMGTAVGSGIIQTRDDIRDLKFSDQMRQQEIMELKAAFSKSVDEMMRLRSSLDRLSGAIQGVSVRVDP